MIEVSIHAPTRGATIYRSRISKQREVSIHAPTRGATSRGGRTQVKQNQFQSTHPHGVRRVCVVILIFKFHVSIHAPTRGATSLLARSAFALTGFNPRTHTGCDANERGQPQTNFLFQSTHPHGVRLCAV